MRRLLLVLTAMSLLLLPTGTAAADGPAEDRFPEVISLPAGFYPEGIEIGRGTDFFVGSLLDGALYRGDLRTGEGEVLVAGTTGRTLVGLEHDRRTGLVWAAGVEGGTGTVFAFDDDTGELVHEVAVPQSAFLNDLVVTRRAIHVTDSLAPRFWTIPLSSCGAPDGPAVAVPLSGDFRFVTEGELPINLNGIEATKHGRTLIAVHSTLGLLYRIDPSTGVATEVDLGGEGLELGDGIVLEGRTLYVVQNFPNTLSVVELDRGLRSGEVVDRVTSPLFREPTTAALHGKSIYVVNARFSDGLPPQLGGELQQLDYEVVRLPR